MQTFTFSNINKTSFNISMHKSYHVPCLWPSVVVDDIEISLSAGIVADLYFAASDVLVWFGITPHFSVVS